MCSLDLERMLVDVKAVEENDIRLRSKDQLSHPERETPRQARGEDNNDDWD